MNVGIDDADALAGPSCDGGLMITKLTGLAVVKQHLHVTQYLTHVLVVRMRVPVGARSLPDHCGDC